MTQEKTKTFNILWLLPFTLTALLFGCDLFLASEKPRDNPLDPSNPTKAITEFKAYGFSSTSVKVDWRTDTGDNGEYPSVIIVRNSVQEPTSINDGTLVYTGPTTIADGEDFAGYTDTDVTSDSDYYYGIWSYTDQDGTLYYNGPVTDTATTKVQFAEITPVTDGYLYHNEVPWDHFFTMTPMSYPIMNDPGMNAYYYFIWFDFSGAPNFGELSMADLVIFHSDSPGGTFMDISAARIMESWDPQLASQSSTNAESLYNQVIANAFSTFSDQTSGSTIQITGESVTDREYSWPVGDIVTDWLISGQPNYGILLRCPGTNANWYYFHGSNADYQFMPRLRLQYYGDPPDVM